jgi:hypothetical protein
MYNVPMRRVRESLFLRKSNKYCLLFYCACLRARAYVLGRVGVCTHISAFILSNPACNAYAPCFDVICSLSVQSYFLVLSHKRCNLRINLTYLLTYLLTPWSRVLPEKLKRPELLKKFPVFYGNSKVHHRIYKSPSPVPILSQIDPVHAPPFKPLEDPF